MTIKEVSEAELKSKLGARTAKMSPFVRSLVLSGQSTLAVDGVTYRACDAEHLELVHKAAPRVLAKVLEPKDEKRPDLVAEYRAEVAAERALEPRDEPASPAVRAMLAAERSTERRAKPETNHELRVRLQREADARRAATAPRRPTKLVSMFEKSSDPKDAA